MNVSNSLLRLFSLLPLPVVHMLGALLGLLSLLRGRHRQVIAGNLRQAGLYSPILLIQSAMELGKGAAELLPIWLRPLDEVIGWIKEVEGMEHVETAIGRGRGFIMLSPHLGCLELVGLFFAARMPTTALYRRPRQDWVHELMQAGRNRGYGKAVEPNLGGVRALLTALRRNEAILILPDQRANKGEGAWAHFFGRPAYMPTLFYRLAASSGAPGLLIYCERLSWGRGYRLVISALPSLPADTEPAMRVVNRAMEDAVHRLPAQYLWTYRFDRRKRDPAAPVDDQA